ARAAGELVQAGLLLGARCRAAGQDDLRLASALDDLFREDESQRAEAAGDQVDAVVAERDRRLIAIGGDLLPTQDLPAAVLVADQRIERARLALQLLGELRRRRLARNEDALPDEARIFQRRGREQRR